MDREPLLHRDCESGSSGRSSGANPHVVRRENGAGASIADQREQRSIDGRLVAHQEPSAVESFVSPLNGGEPIAWRIASRWAMPASSGVARRRVDPRRRHDGRWRRGVHRRGEGRREGGRIARMQSRRPGSSALSRYSACGRSLDVNRYLQVARSRRTEVVECDERAGRAASSSSASIARTTMAARYPPLARAEPTMREHVPLQRPSPKARLRIAHKVGAASRKVSLIRERLILQADPVVQLRSGAGAHQLRRPSSAINAGQGARGMIVGVDRDRSAVPTPTCLMNSTPLVATLRSRRRQQCRSGHQASGAFDAERDRLTIRQAAVARLLDPRQQEHAVIGRQPKAIANSSTAGCSRVLRRFGIKQALETAVLEDQYEDAEGRGQAGARSSAGP